MSDKCKSCNSNTHSGFACPYDVLYDLTEKYKAAEELCEIEQKCADEKQRLQDDAKAFSLMRKLGMIN